MIAALASDQIKKLANRRPFTYIATWAALANGASESKTISIQPDANFLLLAMHFSASFSAAASFPTSAALSGLAGPLLVAPKLYRDGHHNLSEVSGAHLGQLRLRFTTNDSAWENEAVRADLITGEPGKPFLLPAPVIIGKTSNILVSLTNALPATVGGTAGLTVDAQIGLIGVKLIGD